MLELYASKDARTVLREGVLATAPPYPTCFEPVAVGWLRCRSPLTCSGMGHFIHPTRGRRIARWHYLHFLFSFLPSSSTH